MRQNSILAWGMGYLRLILVGLFLSCLLFGCGGGTSGTGDPGPITVRRFLGVVRDVRDIPLQGVLVQNTLNGDRVFTDQSGAFSFETSTRGSQAELEVSGSGVLSTLTVADLREEVTEVFLELELDQSAGSVRILSLSFTPTEGSGPIPEGVPGGPQEGETQFSIDWEGVLRATTVPVVPGARIEILPSGLATTTNSEGRFQLKTPLINRPYSIRVRGDGYDDLVQLGRFPQEKNLRVQVSLELQFPSPVPSPVPSPGGGEGGPLPTDDTEVIVTQLSVSN